MINPQLLHSAARWFHVRRIRKIPRLIERINLFLTGCELPAGVKIGRRVRFQHRGFGVILHDLVTIGDDTMIMPHVVVGQNVRNLIPVPLERVVIGNRVLLGAGAKIIASGMLEIGDDSVVGANAVVIRSVPPRCIAVGVPARNTPLRDVNESRTP
jgi:serine O-acetyltransferase